MKHFSFIPLPQFLALEATRVTTSSCSPPGHLCTHKQILTGLSPPSPPNVVVSYRLRSVPPQICRAGGERQVNKHNFICCFPSLTITGHYHLNRLFPSSPLLPPTMEKLSSTKQVPGAKNVGDCWPIESGHFHVYSTVAGRGFPCLQQMVTLLGLFFVVTDILTTWVLRDQLAHWWTRPISHNWDPLVPGLFLMRTTG